MIFSLPIVDPKVRVVQKDPKVLLERMGGRALSG